MPKKHFKLSAKVSTESPTPIRTAREGLLVNGRVKAGESPDEFIIEAELDGESEGLESFVAIFSRESRGEN